MKLSSSSSTKTISWPEKFPPPLLRFLRSNAKPRTRSKSRPPVTLFLRRKKNPTTTTTTTTTTTQEPSSPKVTCIGQVRVRRSKASGSKKKKTRFSNCGIVRNPCCCSCGWGCSCVNWKVFKAVWCFWVRLFTCGSAKVRTESPQTGSNRVHEKNAVEQSGDEGREEGDYKASTSTSKSPPKNALLLTRSRSVPYRSSSLGCGLVRETESVKTESVKTEQVKEEETERKSALRGEKKEECSENKEKKEEEEEEEEGRRKLKRSRSEPVRGGCEKLDPLTPQFWIQRRLSNT